MYDVIIIGGGPAAVSAGVYTARKKLKTLLIAEEFGGQSIVSDDIQNWIGETHISGFDLAKKFEAHVRSFTDVEVNMPERAVSVKKIPGASNGAYSNFEVATDKGTYQGKTVILAAGARRRKLGVPGEKELDGKGVVYCSTCLPPDEQIVGNSSLKNITEVERTQRVLTHDGTFQEIAETMERPHEGELIEITARFFTEPVQLTPNHPVLATTVTKGTGQNYWKNFLIHEPAWLRADELTEKHLVVYPVVSETDDIEKINISEILSWGAKVIVRAGRVRYRRGSPTAHEIPNEVLVNNALMRLAGYYLAEGSISGKGINFYFSVKEKEYVEDVRQLVKQLFKLEPTIKVEGNVSRVEVYSEMLQRVFLQLFGKYAHGKKIPHWMLLLPPEKQGELVKGFCRGDGCKRYKDFCLVTNSRTLTYQLRDMLLRLGILPSIQRRRKEVLNQWVSNIGGRLIPFRHDKYHIIVGGPWLEAMSDIIGVPHEKISARNRTCNHAWIKDGHAYLPIRNIKKVPYQGMVHNVAVEVNNTYVAKNFIVHNCDAPIFGGKTVAVIGGGNAGLEAVVDLFPYASKIYLLEYGEALKGDPVTQEHVKANPKVEIIFNAQTKAVLGDKFVSALTYIDRKTNQEKKLDVQGVFVEIGSVPNSEMVKDLVALDKYGQVLIDSKHATTSVPGMFAAGDITDDPYKQNNISAGDAVKAALAAYNYLLGREKKPPAAA